VALQRIEAALRDLAHHMRRNEVNIPGALGECQAVALRAGAEVGIQPDNESLVLR
jgi:hypothetical protein